MKPNFEKCQPVPLGELNSVLSRIPGERHIWVAEKHVQYLDDRIHKIGPLTDYLANCSFVEVERSALMQFVLDWTRQTEPDLAVYLKLYSDRFNSVRSVVDSLCNRYLNGEIKPRLDREYLEFWREFCQINETDSVYGMFLTSGRWYVNAMLPAVKELIYCFLRSRDDVESQGANEIAYRIARRLITPCHAEQQLEADLAFERKFAGLFMPILMHFDRKLCFLFELFNQVPDLNFATLSEFTEDVRRNPSKYSRFLDLGIYPPFAWHELHASRKARRPAKSLEESCRPLFAAIKGDLQQRAEAALDCLSVLKEYELNYNNYNYKGRFGLISKLQYWDALQLLPAGAKEQFLEAILLDRFFDAFAIIEHHYMNNMSKTFLGIGAATGQAEGPVHWILSASDIEQFQVGEVLLAKMTSPDWGEVFQKAAAVATEQGGMLCHAAIVAREEGIPAVVGLGEGLAELKNGVIVNVNGDEGTITAKI